MTIVRSARASFADRAALPALLALAFALRVREALRAPLWFDELYSMAAAARPLHEVLAVSRADVHPPLHFLMEWAWLHAAHSDLAVRGLSIGFGVGALAASYALASELFGRRAAQLTALLLALHPLHVYGSQEARSYAALWCFLALSALAAWRWVARSRAADAVLFVLASALALWTHYLAAPALAVAFAWGALRLRREPRRLATWLGLHVTVAALFAPLLPLAWAQVHRPIGTLGGRHASVADLLGAMRRIAFSQTIVVPLLLVLALVPLREAKRRTEASFALALGPLTLLACWLASAAGLRIFTVKYMLLTLPGFMALAAAAIVQQRSAVVRWTLLAALGTAVLRALVFWTPQPEAEAFGAARVLLAPRVQSGDVVFHADAHTLLFGLRYLPSARHRLVLAGQTLPFYEGSAVVPDSMVADTSEVRRASGSGTRWWAMASRPAGLDVRAAAGVFTRFAAAPCETLGVVRVWRGAGASASGR